MAIATRTDTSLAANFTQSTLIDAIKQAFTNAGFFNPIDDYVSGTERNLVYSQIVDGSKTYGTNYLKFRISSSFTLYQQIFTSWNAVNHTGNNGSSEHNYNSNSLNTGAPLTITSLNGGSEYRLVCILQGNYFWVLGIIAPEKRPTWWDLNSFSYGFIPASNYWNVWRTSNLNPHGYTDYDVSLGYSQMGSVNPVTNKRDILTGLIFFSRNNNGIGCKTSDDLVQCCANGIARYEMIQASGNQYLVVNPGTGGLAVRTA